MTKNCKYFECEKPIPHGKKNVYCDWRCAVAARNKKNTPTEYNANGEELFNPNNFKDPIVGDSEF